MLVSECDVDTCECCGEPLKDHQFRVGWDGPVCLKCAPRASGNGSTDMMPDDFFDGGML